MTELLIALVVGYIIGLVQNGVTIKHVGEKAPKNFNESVGLEPYVDYYNETEGVNKI